MFDMIDAKDQLRAIYGFIFSFVTDENLVFLFMTTILLSDFSVIIYLFIVVGSWMTLPKIRPTHSSRLLNC